MKVKYKYPQYEIYYKKHKYKIVVFPNIENAWFYDSHPGEPTYDISMSIEAAYELAKAFAVVIADPQAIAYLPIKKEQYDECCPFFNMVLTRHCIYNFKPSIWYKIKPLINKKHRVNNYILHYDIEKIIDYWEKHWDEYCNTAGHWKYMDKMFVQKELGDTVFCQYSLAELYLYHNALIEAAVDVAKHDDIGNVKNVVDILRIIRLQMRL